MLSREAVRRLNNNNFIDKNCGNNDQGIEDVIMGQCLEMLGVKPSDSRDRLGRDRFMPFDPKAHFKPSPIDKGFWFWDYIKYPQEQGSQCCSDTSISFHYISPSNIFWFDFLVNKVQVSGMEEDKAWHAEHRLQEVGTPIKFKDRALFKFDNKEHI